MTIPRIKTSKHNLYGKTKRILKAKHLLGACSFALALLFFISFRADSTIRSNNNIRKGTQAYSVDPNQNVKFPLWTTTAQDGLDRIGTYGSTALTGSHRYSDGPGCMNRHPPDLPCMIHFPWIDLKKYIEHDEADDVQINNFVMDPNVAETRGVPTTKTTSEISKLRLDPSIDQQYALLTRGGYKMKASGVSANQDRAILVSPFFNDGGDSKDFLMGIMDGHGANGHVVSNFAALELPRVLSHNLELTGTSSPQSVEKALVDTFLEVDKNLPDATEAGSTASMFLRLGEQLFVANTGDSKSFLATYNVATQKVDIVFVNALHKPHLPEERKRIESVGGMVIMPRSFGDSSRVVIPLDDNPASPFGPSMALAMSRSIGDKAARKQGVIPNPTVTVLNLNDIVTKAGKMNIQLFAVSASDGLFDHVPPQKVAEELAKSMYQPHTSRLLETCEKLIMESSEKWIVSIPYRDDITMAVTKIEL